MKKILSVAVLIILAMSVSLMAQPRWGNANAQRGAGLYNAISSLPVQDLNDAEKAGLLKMRQEEKLARDVYLKLYEKWGLQVFANIANSEQRHMDAVKMLLEKYGISDPVVDDSVGAFSDTEFTNLYNELVATGEASEVAALKVGAEIEDLDIADLENLINSSDNDDIKFVYDRLMNGSYHHIKAFSAMLQNYGETYTPKYISEDKYNEILSSSTQMQRGYGRRGRGAGMGLRDGSCLYNTNQ